MYEIVYVRDNLLLLSADSELWYIIIGDVNQTSRMSSDGMTKQM